MQCPRCGSEVGEAVQNNPAHNGQRIYHFQGEIYKLKFCRNPKCSWAEKKEEVKNDNAGYKVVN